jgi:hypothetical protein
MGDSRHHVMLEKRVLVTFLMVRQDNKNVKSRGFCFSVGGPSRLLGSSHTTKVWRSLRLRICDAAESQRHESKKGFL